MRTLAFLFSLHRRGLTLWVEGNTLRYRSPPGVSTPALQQELQARKAEILAFLQQSKDTLHGARRHPVTLQMMPAIASQLGSGSRRRSEKV